MGAVGIEIEDASHGRTAENYRTEDRRGNVEVETTGIAVIDDHLAAIDYIYMGIGG